MARLIWTNDGSKRVILRSEVPFGGLNNVPLPPPPQKKTEIFGPQIGIES